MDHPLVERLRGVGHDPQMLDLEQGATLLVLPNGGRVLGLYAEDDSRNFLWTHPALEEEGSAGDFLSQTGWPNSGGDRTWLAPEIDLFFQNYPDVASYVQPPSLDPGSYRVWGGDGKLHLQMEFGVARHASGERDQLRLTKTVRGLRNPLPEVAGVQFSGYETNVVLEALSNLTMPLGQWQLLQMPHGGEMIIPTYVKTQPLVVFGEPPAGHLRVSSRAIRYRTSADSDHKIGVYARACTGRVGYLYELGGVSQLVIRNFLVNPSGAYVDANWSDPSDTGYCVQACSANGVAGRFSELEYHAPAMTLESPTSADTSQVWAYRGSREVLNRVAKLLLGVSG